MEAPPGKPLTPQEKEKLKEQLAFLKREYSKTFHRLQRAEKAERMINCIKKRTAEQNEFLPQKEAEKDREESISQMEAIEPVLVSAFLEPSTAKARFVELEPEVIMREDGLPENSGSECSTPDPESGLFCPTGPRLERKLNRFSRSRTKVQQRVTMALGMRGESTCDVLQENAGHGWGSDMASTGSSGSPIFKKRCSILEPDQSTPKTASMAEGGGCGVVVAQPETLGQNVCLGASSPLSNKNQVPSLNCLGIFANPESSAVEKPVTRDDVQCGEQVFVQVEKEQVRVCEEESGRAAGLVGLSEAFQGGGTAPCVSGHGMLEGRSQHEETKNLDLDNRQTSFHSKAGEMGLESQGEAGPPVLEKPVPTPPTESPLSTCTVVEGLLFPIEYYVRTTRRMSRCQQAVDVAAVLQGQLGKRRRGQGASQKESRTAPGLPSQDPAGSQCQLGSAPCSPPGACVGHRCDSISPLQPLPLSDAAGRGLTQQRRGRRPRGRAGRRVSPGTLAEPAAPEDRRSIVSCEAQGRGVALPVRTSGSQEAPPAELDLAASRCPEAKLEGVQSSFATLPGTDSALSCVRDLDVSSIEAPRPERRTWQQEGSQSSSGPVLEPLDAALLPWCKPLRAAPPGGKGSSLLIGSQSHPEPLNTERETASQNNLPSPLHLQEFHLPGGKHGLPRPQACAVEQLEVLDSTQSGEQCADPGVGSAAGENLCNVSLEEEPHESGVQWPLHRKEFPSSKLLLSPAPEGVASQLESQLPTSIFPLVGATPASQALLGVSPLQAKGSWSKPEDGTRKPGEAAAVGLKESQSPARQSVEHCKESVLQIDTAAEGVAEALQDSPRERNLKMTAELKASSSSCSVDLSAVWWGEAGSAEFCIAIACEASVFLWRCLESGHWGVLHTWHFAEVPVSQIVPLPDVHSVLCVALGGWEIAQIRFLFQSSEDGGPEHSQVKTGDIKAVLGLKNRRLVVSCGSLLNQTIEVIFFSEAGRSQKRRSLMPPQENISTFAEVDGMQDALLGLTAANCVVIWNLITGQLLRRIPVGQPDANSVCHKAFSNSGLLFVVLSCPHAKESKADRTAAFQVIALNPKTAKSTGVALLSLPRGIAGRQAESSEPGLASLHLVTMVVAGAQGLCSLTTLSRGTLGLLLEKLSCSHSLPRYVEGNVRGTSAAAVLTSGTIAVWDLLLGQCTALLPPSSEGSWSLVRWSTVDDCLLARRTDGSIYLFSYTARLPCS